MTMNDRTPVYSRILAGADGSEQGEEATVQAARLTFLTGAELDVVHAVHPAPAVDPRGRSAGASLAQEYLYEARRLAGKEGVEPGLRLLLGHPVEALVRDIEESFADMIVVGPDRRFPHRHGVLGGVASHLVRSAPCSVLVARRPADPSRRFPAHVVCAVDGSEESLEAVRQAAEVARAAHAKLRLLSVVPVFHGNEFSWTVEADVEGFDSLQSAVEVAATHGVEPIREMLLGRPGLGVTKVAHDEGADLIVVGSRELHGMRRIGLRSVSQWVARHADCSVLVARRAGR